MYTTLPFNIPELSSMKHYPDQLYYRGELELLYRPKISIVGTRRPNPYTRAITFELAKKLSFSGVTVVSGAAAGVDAIAHQGSGADNTIAILPSGINVRYPSANAELIESIEKNGLTISPFEPDFTTREWSFVVRNEIVVALGDALIVTEADIGSGSMRSVEYALEMGKSIYVLPHRIRESTATRSLLREGKATAIDDIDLFVAQVSQKGRNAIKDTLFVSFCRTNPTYEEVVAKFPSDIFEAELSGVIEVRNGRVVVV
ncbi:DNA-processing protein DprA [Sulfuricurvum sp.]|uniref:DNA-processing protein DprA n=1 Tax=Sulfuricurvum sp. TaxID=2025608 RepID=UPI00286E7E5D|nr:DNA-processing protein DprA [Sulfuricurvum sp.]